MKVKELIEELKKLDQDKGIWVLYDGFREFPPLPNYLADDEYGNVGEVQIGDYIIDAG